MNVNNNHLKCDAILFDLDGVLIDSTSCIIRHWKNWADQHGIELDKIMEVAHGIRTIETIRQVAPHLDAQKEAQDIEVLEVSDNVGVVSIEGASQLLTGLPANAWTIVTSASLDLATARLKQANLPAPTILVTADDVQQGKPDPEPYLVGAKRLGVPVNRCVVVEDAPAGIIAGKRAGMKVIGITKTYPRELLSENGADFVIDHLTRLQVQATTNDYRLDLQME